MKARIFILTLIISNLILPSAIRPNIPPEGSEPKQEQQPPDTLSDWQMLQMAIAYTESRYNPDKLGKAKDAGIYQITPIYVREINRLLGEETFRHEEAFDIRKSIEMFNAMQDLKNPDHDLELAIHFHNKSSAYKTTVLKNYTLIKRYEEVRKALKEYENN